MVQNTMGTAIMIIASVIAVVAIINAIYPTLNSSGRTILASTADTNEQTKTLMAMSSYGFVSSTTLDVWVKNSGRTSISESELQVARVYFGNDSGSMKYYPASVSIEEPNNGDVFLDPGETLKVEITSGSLPQNAGIHRFRLALPNGAISEYTLAI